MADFDSSSLLYLAPLTLHALAALAFFTRSVTTIRCHSSVVLRLFWLGVATKHTHGMDGP